MGVCGDVRCYTPECPLPLVELRLCSEISLRRGHLDNPENIQQECWREGFKQGTSKTTPDLASRNNSLQVCKSQSTLALRILGNSMAFEKHHQLTFAIFWAARGSSSGLLVLLVVQQTGLASATVPTVPLHLLLPRCPPACPKMPVSTGKGEATRSISRKTLQRYSSL